MNARLVRNIIALCIGTALALLVATCTIRNAHADEPKYLVAMKAPTGETVVMECRIAPPSPQVQAR